MPLNNADLHANSRSLLERNATAIRLAAWLLAVFLCIHRIRYTLESIVPENQPWQMSKGTLMDYRDLIFNPGQYLHEGGNPYRPSTYLQHYPQSMEFDPYSPAWLTLSGAIQPLGYRTGAAVFLLIGAAATAALCIILAGTVRGRRSWLLSGIAFAWMQVWYVGIGAQESGSSALATLGVALAVCLRNRTSAVTLGVALALLKPQFGVPLVIILLLTRRMRPVLLGLLINLMAGVWPLAVCVRAEGGAANFLGSLIEDVRYAASSSAPTGLDSPAQARVDLAGLLTRVGITAPGLVQAAILIACILVTAAAVRHAAIESLAWAAVPSGVLLAIVHSGFDLVVVTVAFALALAACRQHRGTGWTAAATVAFGLAVLHPARINHLLGIDLPSALAIDAALVLTGWIVVVAASCRAHRRFERSSSSA